MSIRPTPVRRPSVPRSSVPRPSVPRPSVPRPSVRRLAVTLVAALAVAGVTWLGWPIPSAVGATTSTTYPLADPDTLVSEAGGYVTYGTSVGGQTGECEAASKKVPYLEHGSGERVGMAQCVSGDAMPDGPGAWAEGAIWAPGVARFGDRYFMYYTASKKGTGQKCIGRAVSSSAKGPFRNGGEWACPPAGRWAIDANPFVSGGNLYVAYRDDAAASGAETGLSVVRVGSNGYVSDWSTRRTLLLSTDIAWDTKGISGGTHVVENPSMVRGANGQWYVFYSGNNWNSDRYATGIAKCGSSPLPAKRCTPIGAHGKNRPFFGYTGSSGINPIRGLPGNHRGPGGMDAFQTPSGDYKVVWHWWNGTSRRTMAGDLKRVSGDAFQIT